MGQLSRLWYITLGNPSITIWRLIASNQDAMKWEMQLIIQGPNKRIKITVMAMVMKYFHQEEEVNQFQTAAPKAGPGYDVSWICCWRSSRESDTFLWAQMYWIRSQTSSQKDDTRVWVLVHGSPRMNSTNTQAASRQIFIKGKQIAPRFAGRGRRTSFLCCPIGVFIP